MGTMWWWRRSGEADVFCPIVRKTRDFDEAVAVDVQGLLNELALEFGEDVLIRSAVWMTLRERKSSFAIEGEAQD